MHIAIRFFRSAHRECFMSELDDLYARWFPHLAARYHYRGEDFDYHLFNADESDERQARIWGLRNVHEEWNFVSGEDDLEPGMCPGRLLTARGMDGFRVAAVIHGQTMDRGYFVRDSSPLEQIYTVRT